MVSRTNGKWVITLSRRLETQSGAFNGVVVVTLGIENFLALYGQINIGHSGVIGLTTQSGVLLVRYPFKNTYIGTIVSDSPLFRKYLKVQNTGIASSISRFDKIERIYAYEKNRRYGLVTTVAVSIDEALALAQAGDSAGGTHFRVYGDTHRGVVLPVFRPVPKNTG